MYEVVSPVTPSQPHTLRAATPLQDLTGKRIGFVWDLLFDGDLVFDAIADELRSRVDGVEFVGYQAFGDIHGPDEVQVVDELPARLVHHRIDALIAGVGA